jgi:hypothetical protein
VVGAHHVRVTAITCALKMAMPVGCMPRRFMQMLLLQIRPYSETTQPVFGRGIRDH